MVFSPNFLGCLLGIDLAHLSLIHVMLLGLGSKYFVLAQTFWRSISVLQFVVLINGNPSDFFDSS